MTARRWLGFSLCASLLLVPIALFVRPASSGSTAPAALQAPHAAPPGATLCRGAAVVAAAGRGETAPFPLLPGDGPAADGWPPLFDDLGDLSMEIHTREPLAQAYFNQGLRLGWAFNHAEAARAFRAAQALDPDCAMCYWGEALVLGPNINAPMFDAAQEPALAALDTARRLAGEATELEQDLIAALVQRYAPDVERTQLDQRYATAMAEVAERHSHNDHVLVLYAEARMNLSPWDYWDEDGRARPNTAHVLTTLETVLERAPEHAGAIHLYIHAVEASNDPGRALPHARRLPALMPGAGHMVHMPSHIHYRLGLFGEAMAANRAAVAADERYFERSPSDPVYRNGYYPHNLHFLLAAAHMGGDGETAVAAATQLDAVIDPDFLRRAPALEPLKAAPLLAHRLFSPPERVLALPDPGADLALAHTLWRYARTAAAAQTGATVRAQQELAALEAYSATADYDAMEAAGVPATQIATIARHVARARVAAAGDDFAAAAHAYRAAIKVEDALPYMEPPYWYHPVRLSLAAVLLRDGRVEEARATLQEAALRTPNSAWVFFASREAARMAGDGDAERHFAAAFDKAWLGGEEEPDLARF